jgi:hypothetical protein
MRRIDGHWCEHREDSLVEGAGELFALGGAELIPVRQPNAAFGELRQQLLRQDALLDLGELEGSTANSVELMFDAQSVGRDHGHRRVVLDVQQCDANLEELVEIAARDREELHPLEQLEAAVFR